MIFVYPFCMETFQEIFSSRFVMKYQCPRPHLGANVSPDSERLRAAAVELCLRVACRLYVYVQFTSFILFTTTIHSRDLHQQLLLYTEYLLVGMF